MSTAHGGSGVQKIAPESRRPSFTGRAVDQSETVVGGRGTASQSPHGVRHHPVINRLDAERAADIQLRLADRITAFAGSMPFVYLHVIAFGLWMLVLEQSPWPTLTLAVSLEAIFLSAFVMIGQNRQAAFQQAKADHEFAEGEQELRLNTQLTREIHELTCQVHAHVVARVVDTEETPTTGGA
jgi:uncharacterized membrane protein